MKLKKKLLKKNEKKNETLAGRAKRKEGLIQIFFETRLPPTFFDWLTFTETANKNLFRATRELSRAFYGCERTGEAILFIPFNCTFLRSCVPFSEYFSFYFIEGSQFKYLGR